MRSARDSGGGASQAKSARCARCAWENRPRSGRSTSRSATQRCLGIRKSFPRNALTPGYSQGVPMGRRCCVFTGQGARISIERQKRIRNSGKQEKNEQNQIIHSEKPSPIPAKTSALQRASSVFFLISCVPDRFIAFLEKNFQNAKGGSCAPRAIPVGGVASKISSLRSMCLGKSPAERPIHQPIRHTAVLGDSEILSEKCSNAGLLSGRPHGTQVLRIYRTGRTHLN